MKMKKEKEDEERKRKDEEDRVKETAALVRELIERWNKENLPVQKEVEVSIGKKRKRSVMQAPVTETSNIKDVSHSEQISTPKSEETVNQKKSAKEKPSPWSIASGDYWIQAWDTVNVIKPAGRKQEKVDIKEELGEEEDVEEEEVDFCLLVDLPELKKNPKKGGQPLDPLMNKLLQCCAKRAEPNKQLWRCKGEQCGFTFAGHAKGHVTHHAKDCTKLLKNPQDEAAAFKRKKAPLVMVQEADERTVKRQRVSKAVEKDKPDVKAPFKISSGSAEYFAGAQEKGRTQRHARLALAITKLFCTAGLPMHLISRDEFIEMLNIADNSYNVPTCDKLETDFIPAEQEEVKRKQMEHLQEADNLSLSFDGGTSRGREAFWTFHASIPEKSRAYLVEAKEATGDSHTAEWIKALAIAIIIRIGIKKFCGICISNRVKSQPHPKYDRTLKTVRGTVAFFHKSHLGIKQLTDELKTTGETRALEAIVWRCISAIKKVVALGDVKFEPGGKLSRQTQDFAFKNSQLLALGLPIAKAVHCLESNDANANDVYLLVHAVMLEIEEVVRDLDNDFPLDIQAEVIALLNQRYAQLFDPTSPGNIASKAFLAAAYLNPNNIQHDAYVFRWEDIRHPEADFEGIDHPTVFKEVTRELCKIAKNEIKHGKKSEFTQYNGRAKEFKDQLLTEFRLKQISMQYYDGGKFLWAARLHKFYQYVSLICLTLLAIKLYSLRVNSMAEERTVSHFTWLTPPERSRMKVTTMTAIIQVGQFYQCEKKTRNDSIHYWHVKNKFIGSTSHPKTNQESDEWLDEPSEKDREEEGLEGLIIAAPASEFEELTVIVVQPERMSVRLRGVGTVAGCMVLRKCDGTSAKLLATLPICYLGVPVKFDN
ncbi:hypothetical protein DFH05DRAFT_1572002 [Lentinula detonsa]|uniref:Uncharacterized protein n=1 Tax=Lentinula detonsa TaxID=2804962 RepID=A0A9W8NXK5_9AGAR|nr:hypothetical protein DFH05DRAFT_1572002 [Lentinula detonsa]